MEQTWINGIPSGNAAEVWPSVVHWIQAALDEGDGLFSADCILQEISQQQMQLWAIYDGDHKVGAFVTQITNYPRRKVCTAVLLAGQLMRDWLPKVEQTITDYAKHNGCAQVQLHGRRGWVRQLAGHGWHETTVSVAKDI